MFGWIIHPIDVEELNLRKHGNINAYHDEADVTPYSFQIQKQPPPNSIRKLLLLKRFCVPLTLFSVTTTPLGPDDNCSLRLSSTLTPDCCLKSELINGANNL
jgi:hypothetical protein